MQHRQLLSPTYTRYVSEDGSEDYWVCEDCGPKEEEDRAISSDNDRYGLLECAVCGKHYDEDLDEYIK